MCLLVLAQLHLQDGCPGEKYLLQLTLHLTRNSICRWRNKNCQKENSLEIDNGIISLFRKKILKICFYFQSDHY